MMHPEALQMYTSIILENAYHPAEEQAVCKATDCEVSQDGVLSALLDTPSPGVGTLPGVKQMLHTILMNNY